MARRPPKTLDSEDVVRIAFLLDFRRTPELSHLREMTNYGDRPRELVRLALLGMRYERETQRIADAVRSAGLAPMLQQGAGANVGTSNGHSEEVLAGGREGVKGNLPAVAGSPYPDRTISPLNPLPRRAQADGNAEAAQRVRGMLG